MVSNPSKENHHAVVAPCKNDNWVKIDRIKNIEIERRRRNRMMKMNAKK